MARCEYFHWSNPSEAQPSIYKINLIDRLRGPQPYIGLLDKASGPLIAALLCSFLGWGVLMALGKLAICA